MSRRVFLPLLLLITLSVVNLNAGRAHATSYSSLETLSVFDTIVGANWNVQFTVNQYADIYQSLGYSNEDLVDLTQDYGVIKNYQQYPFDQGVWVAEGQYWGGQSYNTFYMYNGTSGYQEVWVAWHSPDTIPTDDEIVHSMLLYTYLGGIQP